MKIVSVAIALTLTIATHASGEGERVAAPRVPQGIQVPPGVKPFFAGHAIGTQNYICVSTADGIKWLFIGPQATGFNPEPQQTLTHFQSKNPFQNNAIQATWQHSRDTSAVWAKRLYGSTDPEYVSPDAIEWLLLEVTGTLLGPTGGDRLTPAAFIHRVNTVGGKEPATGCSAATLNTRALVPYEADYIFYKYR